MQSPARRQATGVEEDFVDLHIHTIHSGEAPYAPEEMFELAREPGMAALAFSFHGRIKPHVAFGSVRAIGFELIRVLRNCRQETGEVSGSPIQCT